MRQDVIRAAFNLLPDPYWFKCNGVVIGPNVRDIPHALHPAQQQVDAVLIADFLAAFIQLRACGFVRCQVGCQFVSENESPNEPCAQATVEPDKLPPAGAGEIHLRLLFDAVFIARKHKDDLPLNLETATNCIDSDGQTCYVYRWNTFFHSTAAPVGHNLLLALPCF